MDDSLKFGHVVLLIPVVLFIMLYKVVLAFDAVDEILKCDHSNES